MNTQSLSLYAGGVLVLVIAIGCTFGANALRKGTAATWPHVVGSPAALRRTASGLGVAAALLFAGAAGIFLHAPWAFSVATAALMFFVVGGFWGNYAVFGDMRPAHTITNVVIAAIALALMWFGLHPAN